jgi:hypothetical protein
MTAVTIRGLNNTLKYLVEHNRLDKVHPITACSGKNSGKYLEFFIAPEKDKTLKDCFAIQINVILHSDQDAALGASLTQDKPGDDFVMTTYSGVYRNDVIRALCAFVVANDMNIDGADLSVDRGSMNEKIWESAAKRPLPGTNISDVLNMLEASLDRVPVKVMNKAMTAPLDLKDVFDELRWVINRWSIFEHGLIRIAQGKTSEELFNVIEARSSVLYWLMTRDESPLTPSNEEIIELCKRSNNPKFTDTLTFTIPAGYKGGNPTKLMGEALRTIEIYERNYGPFIPEPEYLITIETFGTGVRRFVNPEWMDWWANYSSQLLDRAEGREPRSNNPLHEAESRVRASYADRQELLKSLDVRIKQVVCEELFEDKNTHFEVIVSYQAFL